MKKAVLSFLIALLVVLSGCQVGLPTNQAPETTAADQAVASCQGAAVNYWGLNDENRTPAWAPDTLRISYQLPANASVLFVATENDTVLGVTHVGADEAVVADGVPFVLNRNLSGTHTVSVRVYADVDENEEFDRNTDSVCHTDGESVETDNRTIDFSEFDPDTPA